MDTLLNEEKAIVNALQKYYVLNKAQLINLLWYKPEEVSERIIAGLKKKQMIFDDGAGSYSIDKNCVSDDKISLAFWVLLQFVRKLKDRDSHARANYPSNIFFLNENEQYEIIVLNPNEEHLLSMLFKTERDNSDEPDDFTKYIVVVPNVDSISKFAKRIPADVINDNRVLFATVLYAKPTDEVPEVEIYQVGE